MTRAREFAAGLVALGLILAGGLVGRGFANARLADRFVSVKGVSEREVRADLALWPIQFSSADEDLSRAQARNEAGIRRTLAFLAAQGLDTSQAQLQSPQVTDRQANPYQPRGEGARFIVSQTLILRSTEPDRVLAASQRIGELVASGVVLSSGPEYGGSSGPSFLFTRLNDVKPAMIAEATARAREAAEQFARDARSRLGGIRRASQGVFVILPRDQAPGVSEESQLMKTVRVVTSVDYYLRD